MENIQWLKDVIYLLPIAGVIWKVATQNAQIKKNSDDIKSMKQLVEKQNDEIIKSLNRLNDSMQAIRCEIEVIKALRKKEHEGETN
jgi:hypothetical protein